MVKTKWKPFITAIAVGVIIGMLCMFLGSLALTGLIAGETVEETATQTGTKLVQIFALMLCCVVSVVMAEERRLIISLISAGGLVVIQLIGSSLLFEGPYEGLGWMLLFAAVIGGGIGILSNKTRKRTRFRFGK